MNETWTSNDGLDFVKRWKTEKVLGSVQCFSPKKVSRPLHDFLDILFSYSPSLFITSKGQLPRKIINAVIQSYLCPRFSKW